MTPRKSHMTRGPALPAAAIAVLLLAGCSSGHIGDSWQCPLAEGGACDSVAAADPAVPDMGAARKTLLTEPLWRQRAGKPGEPVAAPCEAACGGGFDPFGWLIRLFGGGEGEDRAAAEETGPDAAASHPVPAKTVARAREPEAVPLPAEPARGEDEPGGGQPAHRRGGGAHLDRTLRGCRRRLPRGVPCPRRAGARRLEAAPMTAGGLARLLELFEGPEAPGPWTPPAMPAALHALLPWRAFDEASELYVNAGSTGFAIELPPFAGIDAETLGALAGTLADAAPERCTIQVIHWASPRFGAASRSWAEPRSDAGGALARMVARRRDLLSPRRLAPAP